MAVLGGVRMRGVRGVFGIAVGLASFLLFCCEPMAAKELLPVFGGSAAVWMTCLVFFQGGLLAGYGYAGWVSRGIMGGRQLVVHGLLLAWCVGSAAWWAAGGGVEFAWEQRWPVWGIFCLLALRVGAPFVLLGATTPLLQVWFTQVTGGAVPYRLFGLSNAASLGALVMYPVAIEPRMGLGVQRWGWCAGVAVFAGISGWLALFVARREKAHVSESRDGAPPFVRGWRWMWFLLPAGGALQLSAVTEHLTRNVAAMPLLWVLPLAVYLVSFVVAFELPALYRRGAVAKLLAVMLGGAGYLLAKPELGLPLGLSVGFFLLELFCACWMLHAELYGLRPMAAGEAARFYLEVAAGGVAGSALVGVAAPGVFSMNYDLALVLLVTAVLVLAVMWQEGARRLLWGAGCAALVGVAVQMRVEAGRGTLLATRNFYGSLRVRHTAAADGSPMRVLVNGTIEHGTEVFSAARMMEPTTYYARDSGVGLAMAACCGGRPRSIGVVGLGAGTLAAYGEAGDAMRFYEIDPAVRPVAENLFAYLRESGAEIKIVEGDGRAMLEHDRGGAPFDVLVVDAFTGDAIPLHLLTREAMAVYRRRLRPGGVMAFHVSNQFVDLAPEVAELARDAGMEARSVTSMGNEARGEFRATWVLVAEDSGYFEQAGLAGKVNHVEPVAGVRAWTDANSSLLRLLRW